ncbi:hypothetical protein BN1723_020296, partial [Verticillium longisporum]
QGRP